MFPSGSNDPDALNETASCSNAVVAEANLATGGWSAMLTVAEPEADCPLESVTRNSSSYEPLLGSVTGSVPLPEYGPVPPVAQTLQSKVTVAIRPDDGQVTLTTIGCGRIVTLVEPDAVRPLASLTLNDSVMTPLAGSGPALKSPIPL